MGARLHKYDLDLTAYATGNVVQYMTDPPFAKWVRRYIKTPALADHLRARSDDSLDAPQVRSLFSDNEMYEFASAFEDGPPGGPWEWVPYESLHRRHIQTIGEVRDGLTRQIAEGWSADCAGYVRRLEVEGLSLHDGFEIIREWVQRLRALQMAMGDVQFVPPADVPKGHVQASFQTAAGATTDDVNEETLLLADNMGRMRRAMQKLSADATARALIKEAQIKNQDGRRALRSLAELGEYKGFTRQPPPKRTGQ